MIILQPSIIVDWEHVILYPYRRSYILIMKYTPYFYHLEFRCVSVLSAILSGGYCIFQNSAIAWI
jgi:hypothetical protein